MTSQTIEAKIQTPNFLPSKPCTSRDEAHAYARLDAIKDWDEFQRRAKIITSQGLTTEISNWDNSATLDNKSDLSFIFMVATGTDKLPEKTVFQTATYGNATITSASIPKSETKKAQHIVVIAPSNTPLTNFNDSLVVIATSDEPAKIFGPEIKTKNSNTLFGGKFLAASLPEENQDKFETSVRPALEAILVSSTSHDAQAPAFG